jgi:hypothetical protein
MLQSAKVPALLARGVSRATIYAVRSGRPLYAGTKARLIKALESL